MPATAQSSAELLAAL